MQLRLSEGLIAQELLDQVAAVLCQGCIGALGKLFLEGLVLRVHRIVEELLDGRPEHPSNRRVRRMALHHPNELRVGRSLQLVFRDFLDAVDQAWTRGAIEEGLGVGRTEFEVGDDVGLADPHRKALKARRGTNGLVMNRMMTGDGRRSLGHTDSNTQN